MDDIISQPLISYWQIAADGIWEQARELPVSPRLDRMQDLLGWVGASSADIAIEAFFGDKLSDNFCFFGVRLASLSKKDQKAFIQELVENVEPSDNLKLFSTKFGDLLKRYVANNEDVPVPERAPDFLELGAEGFWKSYGSYVVWRRGEGAPKSLADISQYAPQLLQPFERAIMMEHAWKSPLPMWFAKPVSRKTEDGFVFDGQKYQALIGAVLSGGGL